MEEATRKPIKSSPKERADRMVRTKERQKRKLGWDLGATRSRAMLSNFIVRLTPDPCRRGPLT